MNLLVIGLVILVGAIAATVIDKAIGIKYAGFAQQLTHVVAYLAWGSVIGAILR